MGVVFWSRKLPSLRPVPVFVLAAALAGVLFGACAGMPVPPEAPAEVEPEPLPEPRGYGNVLIAEGARVALPPGWVFGSAEGHAAEAAFGFSDPDSSINGMVELVKLNPEQTGATLPRVMSDLEQAAGERASELRWITYLASDREYLFYALQERDADDGLRYTVIVARASEGPSGAGVDPAADGRLPISAEFDIVTITLESDAADADALRDLLPQLLAEYRMLNARLDGRYRDGELAFYRLNSRWQWAADLPGGVLVTRLLGPEEHRSVALWRRDAAAEFERSERSENDRDLGSGTRELQIGRGWVSVEYSGFFRPAPSNRRAVVVHGSFLDPESGTEYALVIRQAGAGREYEPRVESAEELIDDPEVRRVLMYQIELHPTGAEEAP